MVAAHPDRLRVVGLAAGSNVDRFAVQVATVRPQIVSLAGQDALDRLRASGSLAAGISAGFGDEGLTAVATHPDVDLVLCASSGTAALGATLAAIEAGKTIALANKEVLVMAGALMVEAACRHGVRLLPVDSEHNAIHQCVDGRPREDIVRYILTASGGPFREWPAAALERVTPEDALRHPTWSMGPKITVDSATLMNKGLELIEARWLFDAAADQLAVVVHPQSIVHSLVELRDGSCLAQLGVTDMRLPIQYAFSYPERWMAPLPPLDLTAAGRLEFLPPDAERFPCLRLARHVLAGGAGLPVVLNAANEVAVAAFLERRLPFPGIPRVIEETLDSAAARTNPAPATLAEVRELDAWARAAAATATATATGAAVRNIHPGSDVRSKRTL